MDYLISLGVPASAAQIVADYVDKHGTVFQQFGVDEKVAALINAIRTHTWFKYGSLESVVSFATGGRQGCKLGGVLFNAVYAQALGIVRERLRNAKIVLVVKSKTDMPFWAHCPEQYKTQDHEVVEATFVDDEALALVASSPKALDKAIGMLLEIVTEVFEQFLLKISWKKGKSEALLRYRAKGATQATQNRKQDGGIVVRLPARCGSQLLHVVDSYKHLGGHVAITSNLTMDGKQKVSNAMSAYCPLACK